MIRPSEPCDTAPVISACALIACLPVGVGHRRVETRHRRDEGRSRDLAEQPGAGEVGGHDAGDLFGDARGRGVLGHEARHGEGQRLDHAFGDLDAQGAALGVGQGGGQGKAEARGSEHEAERADRDHELSFPSDTVLAGAVTDETTIGQRRWEHPGSFRA